jgi:hypothetical protein
MAEVTTTVDGETGARMHVISGELTAEDLIRTLSDVYASSDYDPGANSLWDLRGVESHHLGKDDLRRIAELVTEHRQLPPGMCAALVVGSNLDFGLARMLEQMLIASTEVEVMVFRDIIEAKAWLKVVGKEESCP